MKKLYALTGIVFLIILLASSVQAGRKKEIVETFEAKEVVSINTVSGDCQIYIGKSNSIEVRLVARIDPEDSFEPNMRARGNRLQLSERFSGSSSGSSKWILTVPQGTRIEFNTASGDLTVDDLKADIHAETASGDVKLESCQGRFIVNTASGDIDALECVGEFELASASGDVTARDVELTRECEFSAASGNVRVVLARSPEHDLRVSSASGDAELDFNGNPLNGYFVLSARYHRGEISAPVDFDDEERFEKYGQRYIAKSFTRGEKTPEIYIETASGEAVLKEG